MASMRTHHVPARKGVFDKSSRIRYQGALSTVFSQEELVEVSGFVAWLTFGLHQCSGLN